MQTKDIRFKVFDGELMHDVNDKEIWEDDIVKVKYQPRLGNIGTFYGTVFEDDGLWMIDFQNDGVCLCISGPEFEIGIESIEVIGNIWENKDMFDIEKNGTVD